MFNEYIKKIEIILDNMLEANADNAAQIEIVHNWLNCEWLCTDMEMHEFHALKTYIEQRAVEKLKELN